MVYVEMTRVYAPISVLVLYVAFECGDLPRFQTEVGVFVSKIVYTVMSYGGCFYPKKRENGLQC